MPPMPEPSIPDEDQPTRQFGWAGRHLAEVAYADLLRERIDGHVGQ